MNFNMCFLLFSGSFMRKVSLIYFIVINAVLSSIVNAETLSANISSNNESLASYQNKHFYIGARTGWTVYDDACGKDVLACNNNTLGFGIYGGYQFNYWFALEGGMTSYGSPDAHYSIGNVDTDIYGTDITMKFSYPITKNTNIFSRLGGTYLSINKGFSFNSLSISSHQWDVISSLGIEYCLSNNWSLRGEYQYIDGIGDSSVNQADQHFTSIGLTYHFDQSNHLALKTSSKKEAPQQVTNSQQEQDWKVAL